jgi:hypothetical protein
MDNSNSGLNFSQRLGLRPVGKEIQLNFMDDDLKNGLWNLIKIYYLDPIKSNRTDKTMPSITAFLNGVWHGLYKLPIDTIRGADNGLAYIRSQYFYYTWDEVYIFIEFLLNLKYNDTIRIEFIKAVNLLLETEFSGYRIMNDIFVPISNSLEFDEIQNAISNTNGLTALQGANIHLDNALSLLSDKQNPNYRNSIKESISAVEATCRIITKESTLGLALSKLESKGLEINPQLKEGFDKIYAYTNSKGSGIRHAIVEQPDEPDFHDAKYMLIACSSFINYLIGKADKIGIKIE